MKRSDLENYLQGDLARSLDLSFFKDITADNFHEKLEMLSSFCVGILTEEYGMLPPAYEKPAPKVEGLAEFNWTVYEWEPEDEI